MKSKVIKCTLSERSIDNAIKELTQYKWSLSDKLTKLRNEVGSRLAQLAQRGFDVGIADETIEGGSVTANVEVHLDPSGDVTVVYTKGEDAVWCEFGSGVYFNGSVGTSPHPKGAELGLTIGSYGEGRGKQQIWCFKDGDDIVWTHGVPASMPMYKAFETVIYEIEDIAKEVFAND